MTDTSRSETERECSGCGNRGRKVETRPVMVVGNDEPRSLCPSCYDVLDGFDLIDHERDGQQFEYGREVHAATEQEGNDE